MIIRMLKTREQLKTKDIIHRWHAVSRLEKLMEKIKHKIEHIKT